METVESFATLPDKSSAVPERSVVDITVDGKEYKSSNLRDGRTVFLDKDTGVISWYPRHTPYTAKPTPPTNSQSTDSDISTNLPEGWMMRHDSKGSPYYFNTLNWKAQWAQPRLPASQVASNMQRVSEHIPAGWEAYFDRDGYPYYYNVQTSETVWEIAAEDTTPVQPVSSSTSSVPDGWEIYFTDDGIPYFYCNATNESHWELPEGVGSVGMNIHTSSEDPFEEPASVKESKKSSPRRTKKKLAN